jgi:hypothetical protein
MLDRLSGRRLDPALLLAGAVLASAALLLAWGSRLTFLLDDWEFLLYRPGFTAHSILSPHGEHISIAPVLIYKALLATVGMSSSLPYLAVSVSFFLAASVLLFLYLRRRVDPWLALLATGIVLFLGPAFDDLLWDFQMGFNGSLACGLGALLLLERGDRRGDVWACALLTAGVSFSSLGLPFIAAACVDVGWRDDRLRRLYIVAVPAVFYLAWWAGWGHTADTAISLRNAADTPKFIFDAAAGVFAALFGQVHLGTDADAAGLDRGRVLLVAALALGLWRGYRMGRIRRELWIALTLLAAFWILAGLNVKPGRGPTESRYLLPGAVFVLMIAAELLRGVRVPTTAIVVAYVLGAAIAFANVRLLHDAYVAYRNTSDLIRADLGALEIARGRMLFPIRLDEDIADTGYVAVNSRLFLSAADSYGSPADSPAEIAAAPEPARVAADKVLAKAMSIVLAPPGGPPPASGPPPELIGPAGVRARRAGSCLRIDASRGAILRLPPQGVLVRTQRQSDVELRLRRFATSSFPATVPILATGETGVLRIPTDRSSEPWELGLIGEGPVAVCGGVSPP